MCSQPWPRHARSILYRGCPQPAYLPLPRPIIQCAQPEALSSLPECKEGARPGPLLTGPRADLVRVVSAVRGLAAGDVVLWHSGLRSLRPSLLSLRENRGRRLTAVTTANAECEKCHCFIRCPKAEPPSPAPALTSTCSRRSCQDISTGTELALSDSCDICRHFIRVINPC
jgi:hypothetical protein